MATFTSTVSSAGAAAAKTLTALPNNQVIRIKEIHFGYDSAPAAGAYLQVESPASTVLYKMPVTAAGAGPVHFIEGLDGAAGQAVIVTLSAGGGSILAYVNVGVALD